MENMFSAAEQHTMHTKGKQKRSKWKCWNTSSSPSFVGSASAAPGTESAGVAAGVVKEEDSMD